MKINILCSSVISIFLLMVSCDNDNGNDANSDDLGVITISDFSIKIKENPQKGSVIGTVEFSSNENESTFSLSKEEPEGALTIDEKSAQLIVKDSSLFDYELYPIIKAEVIISNEDTSKSAIVSIELIDEDEDVGVDENYLYVSDFTIDIDENPENNFTIGSIEANSNIEGLSFTLKSSYPEGAIIVDQQNGSLVVKEGKLFNYELYPLIEAVIEVSNGEEVKESAITINLKDLPENSIKSFEFEGVSYPLDRVEMKFNNRRTTTAWHKAWDIKFYSENVFFDGTETTGIGNYLTFRIFSVFETDIDKENIYSETTIEGNDRFINDEMFVMRNYDFSEPFSQEFRKDIDNGIIRFKRTLKTGTTYEFEIDFILTFKDGKTLYGAYHGDGIDISE